MEDLLALKPLETHGVSIKCLADFGRTVFNTLTQTQWALKMLDASSKIPSGLLEGNIIDFGNYDECLDVDVTVNKNWGSFIGQHCLVLLPIPLKSLKTNTEVFRGSGLDHALFGFSTCIPSTCKPEELQFGLSLVDSNLTVSPLLCHTRDEPPLQTIEWISIYVLIMLVMLCLLSTCYDLLVMEKDKHCKLLTIFSVYTNGKILFSKKSSQGSLEALRGIRFLSVVWILEGHVMMLVTLTPSINFLQSLELGRTWLHTISESAPFAVDTFFVMSGLLLSFVFMNNRKKGKKFNLLFFYLHRLIRVMPLLGLLILIQMSLVQRMGSGPLYDFVVTKKVIEPCVENWWTTLLYIQNYINPLEICVPASWFLAVDMQLYIISPIILFALLKKPRIAYGFICIASLIGIIIIYMQSSVDEVSANYVHANFKLNASFYYTHMRYIPWLIGIMLGHILHETTEWRTQVAAGTSRLSKVTVTCGWIFAILSTVISIASIYPFSQKEYVYNAVESSLYFALTRPLWSLGIAWIIFACVSGYGGIANSILSWRGFRPLSRLTFCIYLLNFEILGFIVFTMKVNPYISNTNQMMQLLIVLIMSMKAAVFFYLLLELPIVRLEKILLQKSALK